MKWGLSYMSKTIREIKEELERASGDERRALYALYEQDKRTGVQKLLISYRKQELAKEQELPLQFEVMGGSTGTDADCIAASGSGVRTVLFSIPQKYMHTPVETVAPEDVKATAELLCAYITDLARDLAKEGN